MNATTAHRGPDGEGALAEEGISLGHNRLAIIDLDPRAKQPMESADHTLAIVFNGEIYNFKELKRELTEYTFKTESDTEVILAAYQKWGRMCVEKMNGMFAFAIWDRNRHELFLARDHIGIKPLYYYTDGKKFIFSSEIKAILAHNIPRTVNKTAFSEYLRLLYVPEPQTMFEGIFKFPPAHRGVVRGGTLRMERYWSVDPLTKNTDGVEEQKETIRDLVDSAVERQLVSDRPLGVFLSGGIDSSIVVDSMSRLGGSIETFSVGFDLSESEQSEKFNADVSLAKRTAEHYGTKHHEVYLKGDDVVSLLTKSVVSMDEPIANATALTQFKLAEFARQSVVVALGGDGGDELFGGYDRYRLAYISSKYHLAPSFLRNILGSIVPSLKKLETDPDISRFARFLFQKDETLQSVVRPEYSTDAASILFAPQFKGASEETFLDLFMDVDRQSWLVDESLMRSDKMSMASGLEMRVPLLDIDIVEYAASIKATDKVSFRDTKRILKDAFRDRLPGYLFTEPKRGWFSPAAKWLRRPEVSRFVDEVLNPSYYPPTSRLFQFDGVREMLDRHRDGKAYNLTMLWAIIVFQIWAKEYKVTI